MAETADDAPTTGKTVRWDDAIWQGGWTTIPNVVLDLAVSPVAFRVYVLFLRYAYLPDDEWPGQEELARRIPCSERTLREALRELEAEGLLETRRRGLGRTNQYVLLAPRTPAKSDDSRSAESADPQGTDSADPSMPLQGPTTGKGSNDPSPGLPAENDGEIRPPERPPPIPKIDGRNLPLDALAERCGVSPRSPRYPQAIVALNGRLHKTSGEILAPGITHLFWTELIAWAAENDQTDRLATLEPAAYSDALVRAIHRKADRYRVRHGDRVEMSPGALRDWWVDLEADRPRAGMTPDEMARFGT